MRKSEIVKLALLAALAVVLLERGKVAVLVASLALAALAVLGLKSWRHRRQRPAARLRRDRAFAYELIEVPAAEALTRRAALSGREGKCAVILGDAAALDLLLEGPAGEPLDAEECARVLSKASKLEHPQSLAAFRAIEGAPEDPPLGIWPADPGPPPEPPHLWDRGAGASDIVFLTRLPTPDATEAPAYLRWGGWNDCPPPEYIVAALRSWQARYGAVLTALGPDTAYLSVSRRPASREEALELAREQYLFCPDIIDQGYGSLAALAAALMVHEVWYFWWD